jgi:tripartite-type tricarboxylate transporter receptor subunit TctC
MTPEEFATFLSAERTRWRQLVTDAGIPRVDGPL